MEKKKTFYLVGNAHLDPVWMWRWQEGEQAGRATVRSALDRMKEFPEYVFYCSAAQLYRWIEESDPAMFEEVKARVAEGRFQIVGGFMIQPDCNNPSGEGFARQALYAQRYFKEKFGRIATTGYNVDSFGHNLMLPQILKKSGMERYIMMRPMNHEKNDLPSNVFYWEAPDGSRVLTCRICSYLSRFSSEEEMGEYMDKHVTHHHDHEGAVLMVYGVGNHGGGPTVYNLELLREYAEDHPEEELVYGGLAPFFDRMEKRGDAVPVWKDDLQHHASGCYSAVSSHKNQIRRGETSLAAAENYAMLSHCLFGTPFHTEDFAKAWQNVCFMHFHDAMGGCSVREVYEDTSYMYGMARYTAETEENRAIQRISWQIDTAGCVGNPIILFNPHSFPVTRTVQIGSPVCEVLDGEERAVPYQWVYSTSEACAARADTIFRATVPPMGYAVYSYRGTGAESRMPDAFAPPEDSPVSARKGYRYLRANGREGVVLENEIWRIAFEPHSGHIMSFIDKRTEQEIIMGKAAVPVVIDEYDHDAWSHAKNYFTDEMARFSDAEVTVTENGPVRATVKVVSRYNASVLTQYFSLEAGSDRLSVRAWVDWHEKHKMLKIKWPMRAESPRAFYEIPFGVIERPANGEEEPGLMWTAVKGEGGGYAIVNDGTYSSSVKDSTIYHTILRSPIYCDHGGPRTAESDYTEQGRRDFSYALMPVGDSFTPVIRVAKVLNKPLTVFGDCRHKGTLSPKPYSALSVSAENIMLSACKRSEDGTGMILRLYETEGKETPVTVSGDLLPVPLSVTFTPYSVNTYYLKDGADAWAEVLLTEYSMDE